MPSDDNGIMSEVNPVYIMCFVVVILSFISLMCNVVMLGFVIALIRFVVKFRESLNERFVEIKENQTSNNSETSALTQAISTLSHELVIRLPPRPYGVDIE